jgi:Class II flagellar assembly regulator
VKGVFAMKVEGPKGTQSASKSKKSSSSGASDADFSQYVNLGTQETAGAMASQSIAQLDVLLAVQGAEDPAARAAKKRTRERAANILGELDKIRIAMLGGNLTVGHMIDVADVVASHRDKIQDPMLTAIMDEVDLRAQVELAKMRFALDQGI